MFEEWFLLSLAAALFNGVRGLLYKRASRRDAFPVLFWNGIVGMAIGAIVFATTGATREFSAELALWGAVGGLGFFLVLVTRLAALRTLPSALVFTASRSNVIFVLVICSVLPAPWHEEVTTPQLVGIALIVLSIWLLGRLASRWTSPPILRTGLLLVLGGVVLSSNLYLMQKYVVQERGLDIQSLVFAINGGVALVSVAAVTLRREWSKVNDAKWNGAGIGVFGYLAFVCFLEGIRHGDLTLVVTVSSTSFVIAIILSTIVYREWMTLWHVAALVGTLGGLSLLKAGG